MKTQDFIYIREEIRRLMLGVELTNSEAGILIELIELRIRQKEEKWD